MKNKVIEITKRIEQRLDAIRNDKLIDDSKKRTILKENERFLIYCKELFNSRNFWDDNKVIDFVNWYVKLHNLDIRYSLENMEIIESFKRGDNVEKWKHKTELFGDDIKKIPTTPKCRVIREGCTDICEICSSTMSKNGFLGLFGKKSCHHPDCVNHILNK